MSSIIPNNNDIEKFSITINKFFSVNKIGHILKQCNFCKDKGISCIKVLKFIFMLVFTGKNPFRTLDSQESLEFEKNVVYRFLNSQNFNWIKFPLLLSSSIIQNIVNPLT